MIIFLLLFFLHEFLYMDNCVSSPSINGDISSKNLKTFKCELLIYFLYSHLTKSFKRLYLGFDMVFF